MMYHVTATFDTACGLDSEEVFFGTLEECRTYIAEQVAEQVEEFGEVVDDMYIEDEDFEVVE